MQNNMEYKEKDIFSLTHKYWYDLVFNLEAKYNRKRSEAQIKRLAPSKADLAASDSDEIPRFTCKNKDRNGVLPARNKQGKKNTKHKGSYPHCGMSKNSRIPERKYKSHISENCFERRSDQD